MPTAAAPTTWPRTLMRSVLAVFLAVAGTGHFVATEQFLAQVPGFLPWPTAIVYVSGVVELGFALALVALPRWRVPIGWLLAAFFVVILPGNVAQAVTGTAAFGLDSDAARWGRLAFQPVLVALALWSTAAVRDRDHLRRAGHRRASDHP
jgi:uncharacterized membrane protein